MFTPNDLQQLASKGISKETVERQIQYFKEGFPWAELVRPATVGDGILRFDDKQISELENYYEKYCYGLDILKFVPASGAASRMFKHLYEFREQFDGSDAALAKLESDKSLQSVYTFIHRIRDFAFSDQLENILQQKNSSIDEVLEKKDYNLLISCVLEPWGLNYGNLPKGLILFHKYPEGPRTSIEEHLVEGAQHAKKSNGEVRIHFTVSPEHKEKFEELISKKAPFYEKKLNVKYRVEYSIQKPSTDTIAVDLNNQPFRNKDGSLLFRPGGHGALIENLNELKGEIVFIKNIDNIIGDRLRSETTKYKKVLGGLLLKIRNRVADFLIHIEQKRVDEEFLHEIEEFASETLFIYLPDEYKNMSSEAKAMWWKDRLNRPVRVCGMVKNIGEPGGGPFLVKNQWGEISLQIVESSQINLKDPQQKAIMDQSTHFNPVDLVCSLTDYKGRRFHLPDYVDSSTGFISIKSKDGRNLKALEHPGLWNGAMAKWLTVFVETPLITFNPVKTINDLLRPEHQ